LDQERTYNWISERLREWRAGTISDRDRTELQRLAQHDPFIADAIEGYDAHPDQPHDEYLELLSHRIKRHNRGRRRWLIPNLTVTAVAASLLFIVVIWVVAYRVMKEDPDTYAATETTHSLQIVDTEDSVYIAAAEESSGSTANESENVTPSPGASRKPASSGKDQPAGTPSSSEKQEAVVGTIPTTESDQKVAAESAGSIPEAVSDDVLLGQANAMLPSLALKRVTGLVTDKSGEPLIGAYISIPQTNLGTTSDIGGRFELFLPQPEQQVEIHQTGYERANLILRQGEEDVPVVLEEAFQQMEAVTLSKSKKDRSTQTGQPKASVPGTDQDSNLQFIDYLRKNSRFPLEENLEGQYRSVVVAFTIPGSGKPKNEKIMQSSGSKDHDDEALRLIRNGPLWECADQLAMCEMEYTIYFK
jgi:TonB family protein